MAERAILALMACATLVACDGGGGGGTPTAYKPVSLRNQTGKTYTVAGPSMTILDGYTTSTPKTSTITFLSPTQINMNGIVLTKDATSNTFRSADGKVVLAVDMAIAPTQTDQILYMLGSETLSGVTAITPYVAGNRTAQADMPHGGSASYTGTMTLYNDLGAPVTTAGPFLVIGLDTGSVNGTVAFAGTNALLAPTTMSGGAFSTTLASTETVPVVSGTIDGAFYGNQGEEIGGTLDLTFAPGGTASETYVGYYGTERQ
jgi:hypothetical protein